MEGTVVRRHVADGRELGGLRTGAALLAGDEVGGALASVWAWASHAGEAIALRRGIWLLLPGLTSAAAWEWRIASSRTEQAR